MGQWAAAVNGDSQVVCGFSQHSPLAPRWRGILGVSRVSRAVEEPLGAPRGVGAS